jgi:hypothetical protein
MAIHVAIVAYVLPVIVFLVVFLAVFRTIRTRQEQEGDARLLRRGGSVLHCASCGKVYDYRKEGCCPRCGAYNRPPTHQRVEADGTVHYTNDAAYEKDRHAGEKVCFEEKECHEDIARRVRSRFAQQRRPIRRPANVTPNARKKLLSVVAVVVTVAVSLIGVFNSLMEDHVVDVSFGPPSYEQAAEDVIYSQPDEVFYLDGDTFSVTDCSRSEDTLAFTLQGGYEVHAMLGYLDGAYDYCTTEDYSVEDTDSGLRYTFTVADADEFLDLTLYGSYSNAYFDLHAFEDAGT